MLTVPPEELVEITGYRQPAAQLRNLLARGFWRACRAPMSGAIILERAHYDAVCAGARPAGAANDGKEAKLKSQRRAA
jgi:hypothetical protein